MNVFDDIEILKHKGCNITGWNMPNNIRIRKDNITIMYPNYPIVFIHFTPLFFYNILYKRDELLREHFEVYCNCLKSHNSEFTTESQHKKKLIDYWWFLRYKIWSFVRWIEQ